MKSKFNLQYFLYYCAVGSIYPQLSRYLSEFLNFNGKQIGTILAIPSLMALITLPMFGAMYDNAKKPKMITLSLMVIASFVALLIPGLKLFALVLIMITVLEVLIKPAGVILDSVTVKASERLNFEFGNVRKYGSIGYIVASVMVANLTKSFTLQIIFYSFALFMILASINITRVNDYPNDNQGHDFKSELKMLMKNKQFFYVTFIYATIFGLANVALNFDGVRIEHLGYGPEYMAYLVPSFVFFEVMLLRYSDRFVNRFGYKLPLFLGGIIISLKWLVYSITTNVVIYIIVASMHGLMLALVMPTTFKYIQNIVSPKVHATAMTILNSVFLLTIAVFNFITGWLIDFKGFNFVFMVYLVIALCGTMLVTKLKEI